MDPHSTAAPPSEPVRAVRSLVAALGGDAEALCAALLGVLDRLEVLVAVKEANGGRYLHVNPAMADLLGGGLPVVGATDLDLLEPAQAATMRAAEQAALNQTVATSSEHRVDRGSLRRHFEITRLPIPAPNGHAARHLLSIWTDQSAVRQQRQQLQNALAQLEEQQIATEALRREMRDQGPRDAASGLYRPLHFDDQLRREIDLSSREHREFALVVIALDPPTAAVAAAGSVGRDRVVEALGHLLRGNTRAMDASCRMDEERFAILLSGVGLATAHSRMEGLRRQCATQIVVREGIELGFTVSMGVASFPHTADSEEELLRASDAALREARRRGGNHVALASIRFGALPAT